MHSVFIEDNHIYVHTYMYVYICICLCIYRYTHMYIYVFSKYINGASNLKVGLGITPA